MRGKVAVVTGASSGLGRHFAQVLAGDGAMVVACARRVDALERLSAGLRGKGQVCHPVQMDVTDPVSVARAFEEIAVIAGTAPDVVVNNAGATQTKMVLDVTEEDWTGIIDLNLNGVFRVAQAAGRQMKAAGKGGNIVNVASILGLRAARGLSSYIASKAAVIHLSKALALEWAPLGIRVNVLAPGYVETDLNRDFFATPAGGRLIERIPTRVLGSMDDLDGPLRLLCSDASRHMTGSVVVVDGGHSINSL